MTESGSTAVPLIESRILLIRGQKVLLDTDLALLYGVETRTLNQAVQRNRERFPEDFLFQLTVEEEDSLRSQSVISNVAARGGRRYRSYAFTEQGIAMLSSVLRSTRAAQVNVAIMRTFVRLRKLLASHEELAHRLDQLEWRQAEQEERVQHVFDTIQHLIEAPPDETEKKKFGFPTSSRAGHSAT